uniref:Myozenin 3a n=1 Tax=Poecilia latipinna TaxID=48699 RepID=A0A3B3TVI4_9TELE
MHSGVDGLTRQRMLQAKALSQEARGGLNLGKKISVPKDVMMEELNLSSNRGSRMFQERQRRNSDAIWRHNGQQESHPSYWL